MRTFVQHEVMFLLEPDEGEVVPVYNGGFARVSGVTVTLFDNDERGPRVTAGGDRCRKDGSEDKRFRGCTQTTSVNVNEAAWVERAKAVIDGFVMEGV